MFRSNIGSTFAINQASLWPRVGAVLLALVLGLGWYLAERVNMQRHQAATRVETLRHLAAVQSRLESNLYSDIQLVRGLVSVISLQPGLTQAQFEQAVRPVLSERTNLRNLGAAPDMVIRLMYPLRGNEKALGLDYRKVPKQLEAVEVARRTGRIVLAGPVDLVQGGRGLIARLPVYVPGVNGGARFWGIVSAVIDVERLFHASGLSGMGLPIEVALRGMDAKGALGAPFYGRPALFAANPVLTEIRLPYGSWQMAAIPKGGWPTRADDTWVLRLGFLVVAFFVLGTFLTLAHATRRAERERNRAELASRQLTATLETTPNVAVKWCDAEGRITYWNRASERMYGWSGAHAMGKTIDQLIPSADAAARFGDRLARISATGESIGPFETRVRNRLGETRVIDSTLFAIPGAKPDTPYYVFMDVDITERVQAEEELRRAKTAAEAANIAKSQFLATMSHEIRTPMNGILGMAQLLLMPGNSEAETGEFARTILSSGETLLTLLNDILDFSKIEAGKLELTRDLFDPAHLAATVVALFADSARFKGLAIENANAAPSGQYYWSDPVRLRQMLANLVSNAVKFTTRGFVRVEVAEVERQGATASLEFSVTDSGIGISPEQQARLFRPFSQADSSTTREYGGTGLGLSIVRNLALLMGGEAGVDSEVGNGSRFWFRIRADLGQQADDDNLTDGGPPSLEGLENAARGVRLLVAEDDPVNRAVMRNVLENFGIQADYAENGEEVVDALTTGQVAANLVLMDVQMPAMDGLEATRRIRQWESATRRPRLPIIALTARAFPEDRDLCLAAGMDGFLTKPLRIDELRAVLGKWLQRPPG